MSSRSTFFSPEFKEKAVAAIRDAIKAFDSISVDEFSEDTEMPSWRGERVKTMGKRWRDPEQVYQAMIMRLSLPVYTEDGIKQFTQESADELQQKFLLVEEFWVFHHYAELAVKSAARCDEYYMFDKVWE